jgi:regulatory protein YycI of two-component signal transduction system YycFG
MSIRVFIPFLLIIHIFLLLIRLNNVHEQSIYAINEPLTS